MKTVKIGKNFLFAKKLETGEQGKYIQVNLYDDTLSLMGTYDLDHMSNGIYRNNTIKATALGLYLMDFKVYLDDAFTTIDQNYAEHMEHIRVKESDLVNRTAVLNVEVNQESDLHAETYQNTLEASIQDKKIIEVSFYRDDLEYFLNNNDIEGEL